MKELVINNVCKKFSDGTEALKNVSFSIKEGEFVLLAGSNGSGKSVLMSLIAKLDNVSTGEITLNGFEPGLVFQDADSQILGETPYEDVLFGVKNCKIKKDQQDEIVMKALEKTGLLEKKERPARMMSGGEKRRLAVAGVLAMNRDLIIFDEPFANLDYPGVKQVCSILKELKSMGKTILLLTHETEKALALADRFIVLDKGEIRFDGFIKDGLPENLEQWSIRNPLVKYSSVEDLLWL